MSGEVRRALCGALDEVLDGAGLGGLVGGLGAEAGEPRAGVALDEGGGFFRAAEDDFREAVDERGDSGLRDGGGAAADEGFKIAGEWIEGWLLEAAVGQEGQHFRVEIGGDEIGQAGGDGELGEGGGLGDEVEQGFRRGLCGEFFEGPEGRVGEQAGGWIDFQEVACDFMEERQGGGRVVWMQVGDPPFQ